MDIFSHHFVMKIEMFVSEKMSREFVLKSWFVWCNEIDFSNRLDESPFPGMKATCVKSRRAWRTRCRTLKLVLSSSLSVAWSLNIWQKFYVTISGKKIPNSNVNIFGQNIAIRVSIKIGKGKNRKMWFNHWSKGIKIALPALLQFLVQQKRTVSIEICFMQNLIWLLQGKSWLLFVCWQKDEICIFQSVFVALFAQTIPFWYQRNFSIK